MTADTVGGVWTYATELARALRVFEVRVALATMGAPLTQAQREAVHTLDNVEVAESSYRLEWMDNPWDDVKRAGEWLLALGREVRPDVVHLNGYAHGALPWCAPVCVVAHSCVLSWWRAVKGETAPAEWNRYRDAVRHGLRSAHVVIAPSQAMLSALRDNYGDVPRGRVIPNGREASLFAPGAKEPFVLCVGRLWDDAKNASTLESIAAELSWPVCIAGDTWRPGGAARHFARVRYLGRLGPRELASWMARASIYALPARYEPFGFSALEAALSGCALVLGDIPSLREIWGDAALFVRPDDHDALRDAIERLATNDALRTELANRSRARALTYSPQRMAARYLETYRELCSIRSPREEAACAS